MTYQTLISTLDEVLCRLKNGRARESLPLAFPLISKKSCGTAKQILILTSLGPALGNPSRLPAMAEAYEIKLFLNGHRLQLGL
jgi:hypothetical protein